MADKAHRLTDEKLEEMEKDIDGFTPQEITDTGNPSAWSEVEDAGSQDASEIEQKANAYDILTGVTT